MRYSMKLLRTNISFFTTNSVAFSFPKIRLNPLFAIQTSVPVNPWQIKSFGLEKLSVVCPILALISAYLLLDKWNRSEMFSFNEADTSGPNESKNASGTKKETQFNKKASLTNFFRGGKLVDRAWKFLNYKNARRRTSELIYFFCIQ